MFSITPSSTTEPVIFPKLPRMIDEAMFKRINSWETEQLNKFSERKYKQEIVAVATQLRAYINKDMAEPEQPNSSLWLGYDKEEDLKPEEVSSETASLPDIFMHPAFQSITTIEIKGLRWLKTLSELDVLQANSIKDFRVRYCGLTELPADFISKNLNTFEMFDVGYNHLKSIPEEISRAENLALLDFCYNQIEDAGLPDLSNLTRCEIVFEENKLTADTITIAKLEEHNLAVIAQNAMEVDGTELA